MTLSQIEQLARDELTRDDPADAYIAAESLARAVLAMLPVVRAASGLHDRADACVDRPWMGCAIDHSTVMSWLGDEIAQLRKEIGGE